jgi:hypothetical protein
MHKAISIFILILVGCLTANSWSFEGKTAAVPVLVELFTSEGCSSCPPADAWLQKLDATQPIAGAQLIVLSEHVDYWDHDGWKDPYSSSLLTARQRDYEHALRMDSPFTPQVVVNGKEDLRLSDPALILKTFQHAATALTVPVTITSLGFDRNPPILHAHVDVDGGSSELSANVYEAVTLDHAESQVLHGENGGKHLTHVAVVQQLEKIGKIEKGKAFSRTINLALKPGTDPRNIRLIIFVQEAGPGEVLGAAVQGPIS